MKELIQSIRDNAIGLALFAMVTAGAIAVTQNLTEARIAANLKAAEAKALNQIIPTGEYENDLLSDTLLLNQAFDTQLLGPIPSDAKAWFARKNGAIYGVIFPVIAPEGYTTNIEMLVGIKHDGTLLGVRVVQHKETPGLGDKIEARKSDWVLGFDGKSLQSPQLSAWTVKKDGGEFDQFTGATITPRAVVRAVRDALTFYSLHQQQILTTPEQEVNDGN